MHSRAAPRAAGTWRKPIPPCMVLDAPVLGGMRFGSVLVLSWCFWRCSMVCRARCATYRVLPDTHVLRGVLRALGILPGYPTFAQFCTESVLYLRFSPLKKYAKPSGSLLLASCWPLGPVVLVVVVVLVAELVCYPGTLGVVAALLMISWSSLDGPLVVSRRASWFQ